MFYLLFSCIYYQKDGAAVILPRTSLVIFQIIKVYLQNLIVFKPWQFHILAPYRFTWFFLKSTIHAAVPGISMVHLQCLYLINFKNKNQLNYPWILKEYDRNIVYKYVKWNEYEKSCRLYVITIDSHWSMFILTNLLGLHGYLEEVSKWNDYSTVVE